jgi:hypothetical protein
VGLKYYLIFVENNKTHTMDTEEIIKGLMLMLEDENIDVMKLSKRIGYKNYKKFDKAYNEAFNYIN